MQLIMVIHMAQASRQRSITPTTFKNEVDAQLEVECAGLFTDL